MNQRLAPQRSNYPLFFFMCSSNICNHLRMHIRCSQQSAWTNLLSPKLGFYLIKGSELTCDRYKVSLTLTFKVKRPVLRRDSDLEGDINGCSKRATAVQQTVQAACKEALSPWQACREIEPQMQPSRSRAFLFSLSSKFILSACRVYQAHHGTKVISGRRASCFRWLLVFRFRLQEKGKRWRCRR